MAVAGNLVCSPNAAVAFDFLVGKGLKDFQAAGVIGNLHQESKLDPTVHEIGGGPGIGIAQWGPPRWKNLLAFAEWAGLDPWALDTQLKFLWVELETNPSLGLKALEASRTLEEAVVVFQDKFERCGICATQNRIAFAQSALYACPAVKPPSRSAGILAAVTGAVALVAAGAFGAFSALRSSRRSRRR